MLHLASDPDPGLAGVLPELLNPPVACRLGRVLACVGAELDVRERSDDQDLLAVHPDLGCPAEPLRRDPALEPCCHLCLGLRGLGEAQVFLVPPSSHASDLLCNGDYKITPNTRGVGRAEVEAIGG